MTEVRTPVEQLNELVRGIQFAMFTTIHVDGFPHSCPMATQEADAGGHLWFFTRTDTSKVLALRDNKNVCVAYAEAATDRYVSVTGIGELVRNEAKARELWNPLYKTWFPQGLDDPKLVLIRVLITEAEFWDAAERKMVRVAGFSKKALADEVYPATSNQDL